MAATEANLRSDSKPQGEIGEDWSDLPADLLQSISEKLPDIADLIYFRTVCKRWRTAASIADLSSQIPWLLEEGDEETDSNSEYLRFYCLLSGKVRTVRCPQSPHKQLHGPSHGYLYAVSKDEVKYSLINPLTKDEVTIPLSKYSHSDHSWRCMGADPFGNDHMAFLLEKKYDGSTIIGFYQPRQGEWKYDEGSHYDLTNGQACLKGMFYWNEAETGVTVVTDIASGSSFLIPPPETCDFDCSVYFVESAGRVLRIVQKPDPSLDRSKFFVDIPDPSLDRSKFFVDIFQLDVEGQNDQFRWVKTSSIGDQMLFMGSDTGISVTASQSTGLMGNCIYFLSYQKDSDDWTQWSCEPYRYNMEDGKTERIPCPFKKAIAWLMPSVLGFLPGGP